MEPDIIIQNTVSFISIPGSRFIEFLLRMSHFFVTDSDCIRIAAGTER